MDDLSSVGRLSTNETLFNLEKCCNTYLEHVFQCLFVSQESPSPNQSLPRWVGGPGADFGYLLLDIQDGGGGVDGNMKGVGVCGELNSKCCKRHETKVTACSGRR